MTLKTQDNRCDWCEDDAAHHVVGMYFAPHSNIEDEAYACRTHFFLATQMTDLVVSVALTPKFVANYVEVSK